MNAIRFQSVNKILVFQTFLSAKMVHFIFDAGFVVFN